MNTVFVALGFFGIILALLVALRVKSGNKIDIRSSDIVLALVPVALWLFLTGKIQEFAFGEVKIVAAIKMAAKAPVGPQVSKLTVDTVRERITTMSKAGPEVIPQMIDTKSQALSFTLGQGGYNGPAIAQYLEQLTQYPFLHYIIMNNPDGTFFGLADAKQVAEIIRSSNPRFSAADLAAWLNQSLKGELESLPGFTPAEKALHKEDGKRKALETMNTLDVQILPVIDDAQKFDGIVDRSKLTASILTEIADRIEKNE